MDKKTIEKALMRLNEYMDAYAIAELASVIVESKQAIVIKCEVGHDNDEHCPLTSIGYCDVETRDTQVLDIRGTHGTPGKALAIIVPLGKEDD